MASESLTPFRPDYTPHQFSPLHRTGVSARETKPIIRAGCFRKMHHGLGGDLEKAVTKSIK